MPNSTPQHLIIGTAGHIDHGKTALVKALTGINTDRLKEEQKRGLTIDIGFAHFSDNATIIDVPGHEKFIKNMVAGVSTIDLVLFVIAADDGVMPQTREHLDILKILHIRRGIVIINKIDLVEADWLALVQEDIENLRQGTFLEKAPIFPVSATTGSGIAELKNALPRLLQELPPRHDRGIFWLPVDRSFSMKGFGTVVTGSILSGELSVGDEIEILPAGKKSRIRGIQKHNSETQQVTSGDRAAINLHGIARDKIARGDVLAAPGLFKASKKFQGKVTLLKSSPDLKSNTRVRIHCGTAEIMGRIRPLKGQKVSAGTTDFVQITLEKSLAARRLDLFVIRQYSPMLTLGGGVILDMQPAPLKRKTLDETLQRLHALEKEDPAELIQEQFLRSAAGLATHQEIIAKTGLAGKIVSDQITLLEKQNILWRISKKSLTHALRYQHFQQRIEQLLADFHQQNPVQIGISKAELVQKLDKHYAAPFLQFCFDKMIAENRLAESGGFLRLKNFTVQLSNEQKTLKEEIAGMLEQSAFAPPSVAEFAAKFNHDVTAVAGLLNLLAVEGNAIRISGELYFHQQAVATARARLIHYLQKNGQITVAEFKK